MKKFTLLFLSLMSMSTLFAYDMQDEVYLNPACGQAIEFTAEASTGYHFVKWSDGNTQATRTFVPTTDTIITAIFEIDTCRVIFYDWDGTILQSEHLEYGDAITPPADPTRPEDDEYFYTFAGWTPTVAPTVPAATPLLEYTAVYTPHHRSYDITFKDWDGTLLTTVNLAYGQKLDTCQAVPGIGTPEPQRPDNDTCYYTFRGWDHPLGTVQGADTYVAVYDTIYYLFSVNLTIDESLGSTQKTPSQYEGGQYHYGDVVQITVTNIDQCYQFVNWTYTGTTEVYTTQMTYSFEIHENMNLTANLEQLKFHVTIRANDPTKGQVGGQ